MTGTVTSSFSSPHESSAIKENVSPLDGSTPRSPSWFKSPMLLRSSGLSDSHSTWIPYSGSSSGAPDLCGPGPKTHCFPGYRTGGSPKSLAYAGGIPLGKVSGAEPLLPVQQLPPPVLPHKIRILHPFVPMGSVLRSLYPSVCRSVSAASAPKRKRFPGQAHPPSPEISVYRSPHIRISRILFERLQAPK